MISGQTEKRKTEKTEKPRDGATEKRRKGETKKISQCGFIGHPPL